MSIDVLEQYRGSILTVEEGDYGRRYLLEGHPRPLPSVTTITGMVPKPWLNKWSRRDGTTRLLTKLKEVDYLVDEPVVQRLAREAIEEADAPLNLGTLAHLGIQSMLGPKGVIPDSATAEALELVRPAVQAGVKIVKDLDLEHEAFEFPIYHPEDLYGGTIDYVGRDMDGGLWILDWKRAGRHSLEYELQIAAYWGGLEQMIGEKIRKAAVCVLPRTPDERARVVYLEDRARAMELFKLAQAFYVLHRAYLVDMEGR